MEIVETAKNAKQITSNCCGSDIWFVDPIDG